MTDKRVRGAPPYETDLPWHLLMDASLEELLVYYPEHVFQWPGLAILYNHYCHRSAGTLFDYAETARVLNTCRGHNDTKMIGTYRNRLRQWLGYSGAEILGREYSPTQNAHLKAVYNHISGTFPNVGEFLQSILTQHTSRMSKHDLLPAWSLTQVGAAIKEHPRGFFAARVQAALDGRPIPPVDTNLLRPGVHAPQWPMIWRMQDFTTTMEDRFSEHGSIHTHNTTDFMALANLDWALLPPAETFEVIYYHERDLNGQHDPTSQIFGWTKSRLDANGEPCKIFDILDQHMTADEVIQRYWRDLEGEVFLWLAQRYQVNQIIDALPEVAYWYLYKTGRTPASRKKIYGTFRKRAENALVRRLQESKDKSGYQRGNHSREANRKLYLAEKAKYDSVKLVLRAQTLKDTVTSDVHHPDPIPQAEVEPHVMDDGTSIWAQYKGVWYSVPKMLGQPDGSSVSPEWWREERRQRFRVLYREDQISMVDRYMASGWDAQPNADSPIMIDYSNADWSLVPDFGTNDLRDTQYDPQQQAQMPVQELSRGCQSVHGIPSIDHSAEGGNPVTVSDNVYESADSRVVVDLTSPKPVISLIMANTSAQAPDLVANPHCGFNMEADSCLDDPLPIGLDIGDVQDFDMGELKDFDMNEIQENGLDHIFDDPPVHYPANISDWDPDSMIDPAIFAPQ